MEALLIGRQEVSGKKKNNTESPKNEGKERREVAVWKEGVANKTINITPYRAPVVLLRRYLDSLNPPQTPSISHLRIYMGTSSSPVPRSLRRP